MIGRIQLYSYGYNWNQSAQIAENLHRAELPALERDEQVAEWIRLADDNLHSAQFAQNEVSVTIVKAIDKKGG